jgi:hypothetical protein
MDYVRKFMVVHCRGHYAADRREIEAYLPGLRVCVGSAIKPGC